MAGIYIHIPFCRQKCNYCNFHFSTSGKYIPEMMECIIHEITLRKDYIAKEKVETIYFGGGTPSHVPGIYIKNVIHTIYNLFDVADDAEITLEANPDDMEAEKISELREAGINRISLGIQSFSDNELQWMHRAHNVQEANQCLENLQSVGFTNISADLIYGIPGQSDAQWLSNLEQLVAFDITHISCYALTVEPKTELYHAIQQKKIAAPGDVQAEQQYKLLHNFLTDKGYLHYEISNFAKPGFMAKHNSSYWAGKSYLGVGPSAHSFNGTSRQWNVSNNALYMQSINQNIIPAEIEILTQIEQANEMIMVSLRTTSGLSLVDFKNKFGTEIYTQLKNNTADIKNNSIVVENEYLSISEESKFIADRIISQLFLDA